MKDRVIIEHGSAVRFVQCDEFMGEPAPNMYQVEIRSVRGFWQSVQVMGRFDVQTITGQDVPYFEVEKSYSVTRV